MPLANTYYWCKKQGINLNQRDNTFFEAYKRLDRLCRDILNCQNGVSEYIQQMDKTPQAQYTVTNWEKDYKMLKHIRWVRNKIAHDISDAPFSTEADLEFTNAFYDRIINQNDPFSHLRKAEQRKTYANNNYYFPPKSSDNSFHTQLPDTSNGSSSHGPLAVISIIAGIIIIILIVFSLINMNL